MELETNPPRTAPRSCLGPDDIQPDAEGYLGGVNPPYAEGRAIYPPAEPRLPVAPAPARFGEAGFSAGEDQRIKHSITPEFHHGVSGYVPSSNGLAKFLGWFSIGLGLAEVFAAKEIGHALGMDHRRGTIRAYGVREIVNGIAILAEPRPKARAPWIWTRVAGDALDLNTLRDGLTACNPKSPVVMGAMGMVAVITALDVLCAVDLSR